MIYPARGARRASPCVIACLAMTGCVVGPNYSPPAVDSEAFHNAHLVQREAGDAPVSLDAWWNGFGDPLLADIVERALKQNLDIAASLARVKQAEAAAAGAGAQLYPRFDAVGRAEGAHQSRRNQLGSISSNSPGYTRDFHEYAVNAAASWEIDLFGGLQRAATAALADARAAQADENASHVTVSAEVADAYLQIRGYQARLKVARQQITDDERLLKIVRDRYNAGAGTGREIAQAEALLSQAESSIPALLIGQEQQLNRLDVLLGCTPGSNAEEIGTPVREIPPAPAVPDPGQPVDMLRRRPDVIAAERRLAASSERIGQVIADYYPKVSLSGILGFDAVGGRHFLSANAFQALGSGAIRWRLFDFGRVDAEVAQARGANAEALAVYRKSVLRAAEDVENALMVFSQTQYQGESLEKQVTALTRARDLSELAYRAGSIALTDVLDADGLLLTARDQLVTNQASVARSAVGLYRALGGGWMSAASAAAIKKPDKNDDVALHQAPIVFESR